MREPASTVEITLGLQHNSILCVRKFADEKVNHNIHTRKVKKIDCKQAILTSTDKLILQGQWKQNEGVSLFELQASTQEASMHKNNNKAPTASNKAWINNIYDLPSTKQFTWYYHAMEGFPTKARFFATWPMLTTKAVAKYFHESKETQNEHMQQHRQGGCN